MLQLVYLSTATTPFSSQALGELLRKSRENNERLGITGMLVHHHGLFLQVLEGPARDVRDLFDRISADPRHRGIDRLTEIDVVRPAFGEWSMGFFNADVNDMSTVPGFADMFGPTFSRREFAGNPSTACKLLLSFRDGRLQPRVEVGDIMSVV